MARVDAHALIAQDAINVAQAQINLEADVAAAQAAYNAALGQAAASGTNIAVSEISVAQAERQLADAQVAYQQAWDPARDWELYTMGGALEAEREAATNEQFTGTVVQIDPQLTQSGDLGTMRALVQLDSTHDQTLPAGLTAGVNVVGLSNRIVRVFLPLDDEGLLAVGDPVTVELPDLSEVPGTVVFVPQAPTSSASGQATFQVLVELGSESDIDDPAAAALAELPDETSVDVIFVSDAIDDVMAIPVSALVALLEGGYAVEVRTGIGQTQLVAVEVGFFGSNNMIAVTSDALEPGDQVVVP